MILELTLNILLQASQFISNN